MGWKAELLLKSGISIATVHALIADGEIAPWEVLTLFPFYFILCILPFQIALFFV